MTDPTPNSRPDYVLIFRHSLRSNENKDIRDQAWNELTARLGSFGSSASVTWKSIDKDRIAICVGISEETVVEALKEESLREYWAGGPVSLVLPFSRDKPTQSTRLRIIHALLTEPLCRGGAGIQLGRGTSLDKARATLGSEESIDFSEFVESIFPLMDADFNSQWLSSWSKKTISTAKIGQVRDVYGERVAYYFAFELYYNRWLVPLAAVGTLAWLTGMGQHRAWWGAFVVTWALLFTAFLKRRCVELANLWRTNYVSAVEESLQPEIAHEGARVSNPLTGQSFDLGPAHAAFLSVGRAIGAARAAEAFPFNRFAAKLAVTWPAIAIGFVAMVIFNAIVFSLDTFVSEYYQGPLKTPLSFVPMTVFLVLGGPLREFLTNLAQKLTNEERHRTPSAKDRELTFKLFLLQSMATFMPGLFMTFVYLPFAGKVWWLGNPPRKQRLEETVTYLLVTGQIANAFLENVVPFITRALFTEVAHVQEHGVAHTVASTGGIRGAVADAIRTVRDDITGGTGDTLLAQIRRERGWPVYDDFADYAEMVGQFGSVVLFSVVFPLAPLFALANNYVEIRSDAFKLARAMQRPVPERAEGLRGWEDGMAMLTYLASIVSATLVSYASSDVIDITSVAGTVLVGQLLFFVGGYVAQGIARAFPIPAQEDERARERQARLQVAEGLGAKPGWKQMVVNPDGGGELRGLLEKLGKNE
ncbi:hypothetical protein M427DRAFT_66145 [Gonapodya prolifera JEL478]|uniref:DUF590-domain-containing protein n=1 Tax=Gonapodya prolifera (strain JEL478) TaxID=1344416 RepID=A0A139AVD9_GONPJ|nr:hypothetical protein M427DRAFT_66145 [Gonapodya prolifera JEL478]|eukprot:KXS20700.1 hypothetical protein M427DRAFT_66145 [Gonapodya prolifera JEL478]